MRFVSQSRYAKATNALIKTWTPYQMWACCHINWLWIQDTVAAAFLVILQWIFKKYVCCCRQRRDWGVSFQLGQMHSINMWQFGDPLWTLSRGTVAVGANSHNNTLIYIYKTLRYSHQETFKVTTRQVNNSSETSQAMIHHITVSDKDLWLWRIEEMKTQPHQSVYQLLWNMYLS